MPMDQFLLLCLVAAVIMIVLTYMIVKSQGR